MPQIITKFVPLEFAILIFFAICNKTGRWLQLLPVGQVLLINLFTLAIHPVLLVQHDLFENVAAAPHHGNAAETGAGALLIVVAAIATPIARTQKLRELWFYVMSGGAVLKIATMEIARLVL